SLNASNVCAPNAPAGSCNPTAVAQVYTARTNTYLRVPPTGLLAGNTDPKDPPLPLVVTSISAVNCTGCTGGAVVADPTGAFNIAVTPPANQTTPSSATFTYVVQDSQGRQSAAGNVTVNFPVPSNLQVTVVDAQAWANCAGDSTC